MTWEIIWYKTRNEKNSLCESFLKKSWMGFKILECYVFSGTTQGWVCLILHHESHTIEHVGFLKIVQCCKHVNRSYGFLLSIGCVFIWNCFPTNKYNTYLVWVWFGWVCNHLFTFSCCGYSNYWSIIFGMYSLLWCMSTTLTISIIKWSCCSFAIT
jgi:hypothetical protein